MNRSIRSTTLALLVLSLLGASALAAVTGQGTDPNDAPSLLDIEKSGYKLGEKKIIFTVNTYENWPPAVLQEGRIRILLNSKGPIDGSVDAADYVVLVSKKPPPEGTATLGTGDGKLLGNLLTVTDEGLEPLGKVGVQKPAGDHLVVRFVKDRIQRRASGRMLWRVNTNVPEDAPGGSEPGRDRIPNSGMLDSGA